MTKLTIKDLYDKYLINSTYCKIRKGVDILYKGDLCACNHLLMIEEVAYSFVNVEKVGKDTYRPAVIIIVKQ